MTIGLIDRGVGMLQHAGEFDWCARIALRDFGQRRPAAFFLLGQVFLILQQSCGQRREWPRRAVARPHHRDPPGIDLLDDAGRGQPRHKAGAGKRGFTRAAGADNQQIRRSSCSGLAPQIDGAADVVIAAEENRRVLGAECGQPAERRALHLDRPAHHAAARHLVGDPLAQQLFQLRFEIVLRIVSD